MYSGRTSGLPHPSTSSTVEPYSSFPLRAVNPTGATYFQVPPIPHFGQGREYVQHENSSLGPEAGKRNQINQNIAMWVGNIPADASDDELFGFFAESNPINVFIRRNSRCAFINYRTFDEVDDAVMKYNRSYFRSCQIVCRKRRARSFPDQVDLNSNPSNSEHQHTPVPYTHFSSNILPLQPSLENAFSLSLSPARYFVARCKDNDVFKCILLQMKYVPSIRGAASLNEALKNNPACVFVIFFEAERRFIRGIFRVTGPIIEGVGNSPVGYHIYPMLINAVKHTQIPELYHASTFDTVQDGQEVNPELALKIHNAISYAEPTGAQISPPIHQTYNSSPEMTPTRQQIVSSRGFSIVTGQRSIVCQEIIPSTTRRPWDAYQTSPDAAYILWDGQLLIQPTLTASDTIPESRRPLVSKSKTFA